MGVFNKKNKTDIDLQTISTLISRGALLEGNIKAPAFARVDGQINGNVAIDEGLILGEEGVINGHVDTKEMVVYGIVTGNINVKSLQIKSTGKINGDIKTGVLSVETGAIYNGKLLMDTPV